MEPGLFQELQSVVHVPLWEQLDFQLAFSQQLTLLVRPKYLPCFSHMEVSIFLVHI